MKHAPLFLALLASCSATAAAPQAPTRESAGHGRSSFAVERHPDSLALDTADIETYPTPEAGAVANNAYGNNYFGLSFLLPRDWTENHAGPPPSVTGYYVLSSFKPAETFKGANKGAILIAAWDLFFVPRPVNNAMELVEDMKKNLASVYTVEKPPTQARIANHPFARLDYTANAAQLHWKILATEIRCHVVQFVFTSRDAKLLESLVEGMSNTKLLEGGAIPGAGQVPACVKDYATGANVLYRVDPIMTGPRFTTVPVRFVVGIDGRVKHIHVINAFPEQARSVENALRQWKLKPYAQNGAPAEVETGILFKFPDDEKTKPQLGGSPNHY